MAFALFAGFAHAADVVSTFKGVTGTWGVSGNGANTPALGGFPNNGNVGVATYDAIINSGAVTLDQDITIQKFTQSGATVNGGSHLSANELFSWTARMLAGAGANFANASLSMIGNGKLITRTLLPIGRGSRSNGSLTLSSAAVAVSP